MMDHGSLWSCKLHKCWLVSLAIYVLKNYMLEDTLNNYVKRTLIPDSYMPCFSMAHTKQVKAIFVAKYMWIMYLLGNL